MTHHAAWKVALGLAATLLGRFARYPTAGRFYFYKIAKEQLHNM
jgi:hypothetical protein